MHRIVVEPEVADEHLAVHHIADQFVILVGAVGDEPDVTVGAVHVRAAREHRHHAGHVAVADVVLLPRRAEHDTFIVVVFRGREQQVGVVDVGAVFPLGQRERHHAAGLELRGRPLLGLDVVALPDRPEAQNRHLLGVPIRQTVEPEDLAERGVAGGVPPLVRVAAAVLRGGEEGCEDFFLLDEVEEIRHPRRFEVVAQQLDLAAALEPVDHRTQLTPCFRVEMRRVVSIRIK